MLPSATDKDLPDVGKDRRTQYYCIRKQMCADLLNTYIEYDDLYLHRAIPCPWHQEH